MLPKQARRAILQYELWYDLLKLFGGENDLHIYLTCHIRLKSKNCLKSLKWMMISTPLNKVSKMLILAIETILYCIVVTILQFAFLEDISPMCSMYYVTLHIWCTPRKRHLLRRFISAVCIIFKPHIWICSLGIILLPSRT